MTTQPQDHKPAKGAPFKFKAGTKTYTLPNVDKGRTALTGRDVRDATLGGEVGQLGFLYKALEACGASEDALNALYDLPGEESVTVLSEWAAHGDGDGASLGE